MRHELLNFVSHSHHGRGPFKESGAVRRKCQNPEKTQGKGASFQVEATREFCLDADETATLLNDHGSAVTSTARKGEKEYDYLHLSRPSGPVVKCHQSSQSPEYLREARDNSCTLAQQTRCTSSERQEAIEEALQKRVESNTAARSVGGSHSVRTQASTTTGADRRGP